MIVTDVGAERQLQAHLSESSNEVIRLGLIQAFCLIELAARAGAEDVCWTFARD